MAKIKILELTDKLDLGGTAKTVQVFNNYLSEYSFEITVVANEGGERARFFNNHIIVSYDYEKVYKIALENNVIHIHWPGMPDNYLVKLLERIKASKPNILIVFTNVFGAFHSEEFNRLIDIHLFVSKTLYLKFLLQNNLTPDFSRYKVLYNPIDIKIHEKSKIDQKSPVKQFLIGRVARPDISKWSPMIEDVLYYLTNNRVNFKYLFMSAPQQVLNRLKNNTVGKNCLFLDPTTKEEVIINFYHKIDILGHSSRIGESFGCAIAEAITCGTPVVVNSTPFNKRKFYLDNAQIELVDNNKTGFVVNNSKDFAEAVMFLCRDREKLLEMSRNCLSKAVDFSAENLTAQLAKIIILGLDKKGFIYDKKVYKKILDIPDKPTEGELEKYGEEYNNRLKNVFKGKKIRNNPFLSIFMTVKNICNRFNDLYEKSK